VERAHSLAESAACEGLMGDLHAALALGEKAVRVAEKSGDRRAETGACIELAGVLAELQYRQSLRMFDRALELADELDHRGYKELCLMRLAAAAFDNGDLDRADTACRQAIELADDTTNPRGMAYLLKRSAEIATARGRPYEALRLGEDALARFAQVGDVRGEGGAILSLAKARLAAGEPASAVPLLESAARTFAELGLNGSLAEARVMLTAAHRALGDPDRAAAVQNRSDRQ
jgi:tetratricopeptide (TPR) repeat protein